MTALGSAIEEALRHEFRLDEEESSSTEDEAQIVFREVDADPDARSAYEEAGRRIALVRDLTAARRRRSLTQAAVADAMRTAQSSISSLENHQTDPRLLTIQRYARACGYRIRIKLYALDGEGEQPEIGSHAVEILANASFNREDDLSVLRADVDEDVEARESYEDAVARVAVVQELLRARRSRGRTQKDLAKSLDVTQSFISDLERGLVAPRLSTLQRYARATDLIFDISVVSENALEGITGIIAPSVDRTTADPMVVEGMTIAAAAVIENVLRGFVTTDISPGLSLGTRILKQGQLSPFANVRTMKGLINQGWLSFRRTSKDVPSRIRLNEKAASFFGISVREDHVRGICTGLNPEKGNEEDLQTINLSSTAPSEVVKAIVELTQMLRAVSGTSPMGVGVELSGPVDSKTGEVVFAPDLQRLTRASWDGFHLEAEVQDRVGVRTVVTNDASALALREHLAGSADEGLVLVYLSESMRGIGAGLVFNGELLSGKGGENGEIGHVVLDGEKAVCDRCRRDREGCLEAVASAHAIALLAGAASLAEASNLARKSSVATAFQDAGRKLGKVLGDLCTTLNPGEVAIYGQRELVDPSFALSARLYLDGIQSGLEQKALSKQLEIRRKVTNAATCPKSAAAAAIHNFLSRPLEYAPNMSAPNRTENGAVDRNR